MGTPPWWKLILHLSKVIIAWNSSSRGGAIHNFLSTLSWQVVLYLCWSCSGNPVVESSCILFSHHLYKTLSCSRCPSLMDLIILPSLLPWLSLSLGHRGYIAELSFGIGQHIITYFLAFWPVVDLCNSNYLLHNKNLLWWEILIYEHKCKCLR